MVCSCFVRTGRHSRRTMRRDKAQLSPAQRTYTESGSQKCFDPLRFRAELETKLSALSLIG